MLPDIIVDDVRKVYDNGEHNAFTDMVRFNGKMYLTFRSCPDGHMVYTTSRIVILTSEDGAEWTEVHSFSVPGRDVRDPHLLVFRDTLFVYTGTWLVEEPREINHHLGYCAWSPDGESWHGPRFLEGTWGHYIWRGATHGEKAYLCGRRRHAFAQSDAIGDGTHMTESAMLESDDGIVWKPAGFFQIEWGDETAFLFEQDGRVLAVARSGGARPAQVCRSEPPYREWSRVNLHRHVGGPLLARWGDRLLVGGRKSEDGRGAVTAIGWLEDDTLVEGPELPSGGDTSYPGFIELDATHGLLSYYSSHEGEGNAATSIYLAHIHTK